jgi:hypothetical protein
MTEETFDPIKARQDEIAQYEQNIALYSSMASNLPSEWPAHLEKYKGAKNKHEAIAEIEDLADVELVSDLWAHDDAKAAVRTETLEKRKAEAILAALIG